LAARTVVRVSCPVFARTGQTVSFPNHNPRFTADRSEGVEAPAVQVVAHALDRRVEQSLVRSKLLQRANAGPGANDGHEITRLHLFVNEFLEGLAHQVRAFERQTEIVNHQRHRAAHLIAAQGYGWWRRVRRNAFRGFRCARYGGRLTDWSGNEIKVRDFLSFTVLCHIEFFRFQITNGLAIVIDNGNIDLDQIRGNANDIGASLGRRSALRLRRWRSFCLCLRANKHTKRDRE